VKTRILTGLTAALHTVAQKQQIDPNQLAQTPELGRSKNPAHGDYTTNVAMQHAKTLGMNPRQLAEALIAALPEIPGVAALEIAGPG